MALHNVSRWVWVVVGAAIGLLLDQVQNLPQGSWTDQYNTSIGQANFEVGLKKTAGFPHGFANLVIYPEWVQDSDGSSRRVYAIVGDYDLNLSPRARKGPPSWSRRSFFAETPYRPIQSIGLSASEFPSVMAYLDELKKRDSEISYRYVWWHKTKWSTAFWVGGGIIAIGLIWPTLITLLTFRTFRRPREEAGVDPGTVSSSTAGSAVVTQAHTDADVAVMVDAIENDLQASAAPAAPVVAPIESPSPKVLAGGAVPSVDLTPQSPHQYGQKPDDFYPTERRLPETATIAAAQEKSKGFSLVELLVVLGIISLLLAILMPVLSMTREHAKQLRCSTTLYAIGQAAEQHVLEHHGYLPLVGRQFNPVNDVLDPAGVSDSEEKRYDYYVDNGGKRPVPVTVALAMSMGVHFRLDSRQHLADDMQHDELLRLFRCPSQDPMPQSYTISDAHGWKGPDERSSFIFNEALMGRRDKSWNFPQGLKSAVRHTESVMLAMDGRERGSFSVFEGNTDFTMYDFRIWVAQQPRLGPDPLDYTRHHFRANVLFLDGHVDSLSLTEGGIRQIGISRGIYN